MIWFRFSKMLYTRIEAKTSVCFKYLAVSVEVKTARHLYISRFHKRCHRKNNGFVLKIDVHTESETSHYGTCTYLHTISGGTEVAAVAGLYTFGVE